MSLQWSESMIAYNRVSIAFDSNLLRKLCKWLVREMKLYRSSFSNTLQNMASSCIIPRLSLSIFAVFLLAKPLQALSLPTSTLPQLLQLPNLTTIPTLNTSSSSSENEQMLIHCSGLHFGYSPNVADCESAKEYITPDSKQYPWGRRHTGLDPNVFPLPYRIMGGKSVTEISPLWILHSQFDMNPHITLSSLAPHPPQKQAGDWNWQMVAFADISKTAPFASSTPSFLMTMSRLLTPVSARSARRPRLWSCDARRIASPKGVSLVTLVR